MSQPTLLWTRRLGTSGSDTASGVATDHMGHVVIAGHTEGALEAGKARGGYDAFVAKFDATGNELWRKQIGTSSADRAHGVATDHHGHVVIAGSTLGALAAGQAQGGYDAFAAKFDAAGNELWRKQLGTSGHDGAHGIATDPLGCVVITGGTQGALTSDQAAGLGDAFVAKLDPSGEELWRRQIGTSYHDVANGVATDDQGHVVIAGSTQGALEADAAQRIHDAFVIKFDSEGRELWRRQFGSSEWDSAQAVAIDRLGHIVIAGSTLGSLQAGESRGSSDAFVVRFDPEGRELWRRQVGTSSGDSALGVATDDLGDIVITGSTFGAMEAGEARGDNDAFVAKFDPEGRELWRKQIGSPGWDEGLAVATDHLGHVLVAGSTGDPADAFVAKLIDDLSVTHHHLVIEKRMSELHGRLARLELGQLPMDLDLALIQAANDRTRGRGEGRISKAEAGELIALARDGKEKITETRKKTLAFVFARYSLTRGARELFAEALV